MSNTTLKQKTNIRLLSLLDIENIVCEIGQPKYRAKQIFDWIHNKLVSNYDEMLNIPLSLRNYLDEKYSIYLPNIVREQVSKIDGTRKFLIRLEDGELIETVLMKYSYGYSICLSTQVGCRMGCKFCASTINGLNRNLDSGEILGELYVISKHIGLKISHIVLMGMGEPLDNFDNVVNFIKLAIDDKGYNISARNITLSTCGIVPNIIKLASYNFPITLAISLHASNQSKRLQIMPIANKYDINEIIDACKYYFDITKRRISVEYALVKGQNDSTADINELANLLAGTNFHINVIPVNPVTENNFARPSKREIDAFCKGLIDKGLNVTIRREMGSDIDGACGQLRALELGD